MTKISLTQFIIMMLLSHWDIVEKDTELLACGFLTHPGTKRFVNDRILVLIMSCCPIEHLLFRKHQYGTAMDIGKRGPSILL